MATNPGQPPENIMKTFLFVTVVAASTAGGPACAEGAAPAPTEVWAIGLPNGYVIMDHLARVIRVTPETRAHYPTAVCRAETADVVEVEHVPMEFRTLTGTVPKMTPFAPATRGTAFAAKHCTPVTMEYVCKPRSSGARLP